VQILVVVASIQMRTLKAEVEKGSVRTAFGHGLVDPKALRNCVQKVLWDGERGQGSQGSGPCSSLEGGSLSGGSQAAKSRRRPKGNQVNIPEPSIGYFRIRQTGGSRLPGLVAEEEW
jgi:hypothetical protein